MKAATRAASLALLTTSCPLRASPQLFSFFMGGHIKRVGKKKEREQWGGGRLEKEEGRRRRGDEGEERRGRVKEGKESSRRRRNLR